ncbi:sugar phosphate isomerase/epimerase family protein [Pontibacter silvestris]|uniref:Sugar phosphate isomerase/epimerase family protein n=1 Tax=Pontibacter silvestris TaxID=2305183 RepID=A0ABW4WY34_9BACT|nr:sugar phosphate isomerase/epimerase [Pontibacter silvestris]MCC9135223.1 sugar phosphate isomerase/epimerase [Pontibacter silvestris]
MNKRRSFLQQLGMLSAGFVVAPSLISCDSGNTTTAETAATSQEPTNGGAGGKSAANDVIKTVGLQLYTLREVLPNDVKGGIAKVAQAGYQDVETYGYSKQGGYWGLQPQAFKELLDDNGLISSSGHYDFGQYMTDGNTDAVKAYIEAGNTVGHTYITVPYLGEPVRSNAEDYKAIADKLNKAGEMCKEAGLKLAYHNHNFEFDKFGDTTGYEILLSETDQSLVSFEADLYWFVRAGKEPTAMFKQYPNRFVMWHVKDMDKNSPELNTEVGNGSINYNEIFDQAKVSGVDRVFVEQENFAANMDPYQSIGQSYRFVKNTLMA